MKFTIIEDRREASARDIIVEVFSDGSASVYSNYLGDRELTTKYDEAIKNAERWLERERDLNNYDRIVIYAHDGVDVAKL